jgi:hypothetical protein
MTGICPMDGGGPVGEDELKTTVSDLKSAKIYYVAIFLRDCSNMALIICPP